MAAEKNQTVPVAAATAGTAATGPEKKKDKKPRVKKTRVQIAHAAVRRLSYAEFLEFVSVLRSQDQTLADALRDGLAKVS